MRRDDGRYPGSGDTVTRWPGAAPRNGFPGSHQRPGDIEHVRQIILAGTETLAVFGVSDLDERLTHLRSEDNA